MNRQATLSAEGRIELCSAGKRGIRVAATPASEPCVPKIRPGTRNAFPCFMRSTVLLLLMLLCPNVAHSNAPDATERSTDRVLVGAGPSIFARYPGSISDPGVALWLQKPLWLGNRYSHWQWEFGAAVELGYGTEKKTLYPTLSGHVAGHLFLGDIFGFVLRIGPALATQIGSSNVTSLGMAGSGGYVFRFWKDPRKRVSLEINTRFSFPLKADPGNDLATGTGSMALMFAYQTPL